MTPLFSTGHRRSGSPMRQLGAISIYNASPKLTHGAEASRNLGIKAGAHNLHLSE
jgi:hypothetical protein